MFLLDDHEIVRRGIAQLLETEDDIEVVGEAGTAAQAMTCIPALRHDVGFVPGQRVRGRPPAGRRGPLLPRLASGPGAARRGDPPRGA